MDFREMQYIVAIAECGSVTAAARLLYISQPSLSAAVARIENSMGTPLFDHDKKPLELTYAGEAYVRRARQILHLGNELKKEIEDIAKGETGLISFGIPAERAGEMLPEPMRRFIESYPRVQIRMINRPSYELIEALKAEEINFAIMPIDKVDLPSGITTELLQTEPVYIVSRPGIIDEKDLSVDGKLSLQALSKYPIIAMQPSHSLRVRLDLLMNRHDLRPDYALELGSCIATVQFAAAGLGVAVAPQRAIEVFSQKDSLVAYQTGTELDSWDINLIRKSDVKLSMIEKRFIDSLVKE